MLQVRKNLKETVVTVDHNLVASCLSLMDALLRPYAWGDGGARKATVQGPVLMGTVHSCMVSIENC